MIPWLALIVVVLVAMTRVGARTLERIWSVWVKLTRPAFVGPLIVGIFSFLIASLPTLMEHKPIPFVHDEFAYLLGADTFAHGRLAMPQHPMWRHFEAAHVLVTPVYALKYPPGQSLALAAGQVALGDPIWGAIATIALASAATCWMLAGAVPRAWASLGGLVGALHPAVFTWSQSYWGGGVAMLGAALVGGVALRLLRSCRHARLPLGIVGGVGVFILAISRPFEGALVVALLLVPLVFVRRDALRAVAPGALLVLIPGALWIGYDNHRITGRWLQLPYQLHSQQYQAVPLLGWRPKPIPLYATDRERYVFASLEWGEYAEQLTFAGHSRYMIDQAGNLVAYFLTPSTLVLLVPAMWLLRRSRMFQIALWIVIVFTLLHFGLTWTMRPPYMAPGMPWLLLAIAQALRATTRVVVARRYVGAAVAAGVVISLVTWNIDAIRRTLLVQYPLGVVRAALIEQFKEQPGDDLVLVRYADLPRPPFMEWTYNDADIDHSPVIFANDLGSTRNRELLDFFPNRRVWRMTVVSDSLSAPPRITELKR